MDRRTFLIGTSAGLLATPLAVEAQQAGKVYRIGYLGNTRPVTYPDPSRTWMAFLQGLRERGWVEGQNIVIERRYTGGNRSRDGEYAGELVALRVAVIFCVVGNPYAVAESARTVPIVFAGVTDPVASGLVASLARPGGNATGLSNAGTDLNPKRLELLKATVPGATRVAILGNPGHRLYSQMRSDVETAGRTLGLKPAFIEVRDPGDFDGAFTAMTAGSAEALCVLEDTMLYVQRTRIIDLAAKHRLPAMYEWRAYAESGGLMSYGTDFADVFRRAASYVDKILRGAKPGDLPVEQPTKFELVINLKTAKALGLTIPPSLLGRADEVIQ